MRLPTDHLTEDKKMEALKILPFFNILAAPIKSYICRQMFVESYLSQEEIKVENLLKLDFILVVTGSLQFELSDLLIK